MFIPMYVIYIFILVNLLIGLIVFFKLNEKPKSRQPYLRLISNFLTENDMSHVLSIITDVKVIKKKSETLLIITLHRPGLLIGKGGRSIDKLQEFLRNETNENLFINIKEENLWHRNTK